MDRLTLLRHRATRMSSPPRRIGLPIERFFGLPEGMGMARVFWEMFGRWGARRDRAITRSVMTIMGAGSVPVNPHPVKFVSSKGASTLAATRKSNAQLLQAVPPQQRRLAA